MNARILLNLFLIMVLLISCKKEVTNNSYGGASAWSMYDYNRYYYHFKGTVTDQHGSNLDGFYLTVDGPCLPHSSINDGFYLLTACETDAKFPYNFPTQLTVYLRDTVNNDIIDQFSFPSNQLVLNDTIQLNFSVKF